MVGALETDDPARIGKGKRDEGPSRRSGDGLEGSAARAPSARRARIYWDDSSLSTDKALGRRGGTLGPVAAAADSDTAAAHRAGSSAGDPGAEPRGLAPHRPHPSCGEGRPERL